MELLDTSGLKHGARAATLQFFEGDGTTSVPVFESGAPEPSSLALFWNWGGNIVAENKT
jgi:hypothetical protein